MALKKGMIRYSIATGVALAFGVSLTANAQFGGPARPLYTPEPDGQDLKSVLHNWTWPSGSGV